MKAEILSEQHKSYAGVNSELEWNSMWHRTQGSSVKGKMKDRSGEREKKEERVLMYRSTICGSLCVSLAQSTSDVHEIPVYWGIKCPPRQERTHMNERTIKIGHSLLLSVQIKCLRWEKNRVQVNYISPAQLLWPCSPRLCKPVTTVGQVPFSLSITPTVRHESVLWVISICILLSHRCQWCEWQIAIELTPKGKIVRESTQQRRQRAQNTEHRTVSSSSPGNWRSSYYCDSLPAEMPLTHATVTQNEVYLSSLPWGGHAGHGGSGGGLSAINLTHAQTGDGRTFEADEWGVNTFTNDHLNRSERQMKWRGWVTRHLNECPLMKGMKETAAAEKRKGGIRSAD